MKISIMKLREDISGSLSVRAATVSDCETLADTTGSYKSSPLLYTLLSGPTEKAPRRPEAAPLPEAPPRLDAPPVDDMDKTLPKNRRSVYVASIALF